MKFAGETTAQNPTTTGVNWPLAVATLMAAIVAVGIYCRYRERDRSRIEFHASNASVTDDEVQLSKMMRDA